MLGIHMDYFIYKQDDTDTTKEDFLHIYRALGKAIHERGMTFLGGTNIIPENKLGKEDD